MQSLKTLLKLTAGWKDIYDRVRVLWVGARRSSVVVGLSYNHELSVT